MKSKTVFYCTECGNETGKWSGRCPACGAWNTLTEAPTISAPGGKAAPGNAGSRRSIPRRIKELDDTEEIRFSTGVSELDRVLGGGVSKAGAILLDAVRESYLPYVLFNDQPQPRIEIASLGAEAGIIGAAMLS